jgi:DNA-binding response OmpR family regulator
MKVLLLEDDNVLLETLLDILTQNGFNVTAVQNASEAIETTFKNDYDMYLFDINLPDMSGIELLESLKQADDTTPTIFISANVDIETISKGFEVGAEDYIKKPFMPEELLVRLNAKLAHKIVIRHSNVSYNIISGDILLDAKKIYLSYAQFRLFDVLFKNIGKVVNKDILLEVSEYGSDNALRVSLGKLKKILDIEIKNVRGLGYTIEQS